MDIEILLFAISATIVIHWIAFIVADIVDHSIHMPFPILHIFKVTYKNTYITTTAMVYQIYFWANYLLF